MLLVVTDNLLVVASKFPRLRLGLAFLVVTSIFSDEKISRPHLAVFALSENSNKNIAPVRTS